MSKTLLRRERYSIVTFMASPPPGVTGPGTAIEPQQVDEITTLLLDPGGRVTEVPAPTTATRDQRLAHMFVRVSTVLDMVRWLGAYFGSTPPEPHHRLRMQLIGHSRAGEVGLGASWVEVQKWYAHPFYMFNSNPRLLVLLGRFVDCFEEVVLAGCFAGSWRSNGYEVNGRTLLFTLAELWKCKVRGADEGVDAKGFDPRGWYVGRDVDPVGWAWKRTASAMRAKRRTKPLAKAGLARGGLARLATITVGDDELAEPDQVGALVHYFDSQLAVADHPRLALPELTLQLGLQSGEKRKATLLCGAQFLMVYDGAERVCYANSGRSRLRRAAADPAYARLISQLALYDESMLATR